jgi:hypothetical protein
MKPEETIPSNILAAARRAGLSTPLWYVGRRAVPKDYKRKKTLADLAREAREKTECP